MKKIFFFSLIVAFSLNAIGQRAITLPIVFGDTMITSSALDTVTKVIPTTAGYSALGIQVKATKVSGTITDKAYLYSSIDTTSGWNLTDSATAFTNTAGAQSVWFTKTSTPYVFYKVQVRNVGTITSTESLAVQVFYTARRFDRSIP